MQHDPMLSPACCVKPLWYLAGTSDSTCPRDSSTCQKSFSSLLTSLCSSSTTFLNNQAEQLDHLCLLYLHSPPSSTYRVTGGWGKDIFRKRQVYCRDNQGRFTKKYLLGLERCPGFFWQKGLEFFWKPSLSIPADIGFLPVHFYSIFYFCYLT